MWTLAIRNACKNANYPLNPNNSWPLSKATTPSPNREPTLIRFNPKSSIKTKLAQ